MWFYDSLKTHFGESYDSIALDQGVGSPTSTEPIAWYLVVSQMKPDFNFTLVHAGMNRIELWRSDQYGLYIYFHNLKLYIEYYYWG